MTNGGEIIKKIVSAFISARLLRAASPPPQPAAGWMSMMNGSLCGRLFWHRGDDGVRAVRCENLAPILGDPDLD